MGKSTRKQTEDGLPIFTPEDADIVASTKATEDGLPIFVKKKEPSSPATGTASSLGANIGRVGAAAVGNATSPSTSTSTSPSGLPLFGAPKKTPQDKIGQQVQKSEAERNATKPLGELEGAIQTHAQANNIWANAKAPKAASEMAVGGMFAADEYSDEELQSLQADEAAAKANKQAALKKYAPVLDKIADDFVKSGSWRSMLVMSKDKRGMETETPVVNTGDLLNEAQRLSEQYGGGRAVREHIYQALRSRVEYEQVKPKVESEFQARFKKRTGKTVEQYFDGKNAEALQTAKGIEETVKATFDAEVASATASLKQKSADTLTKYQTLAKGAKTDADIQALQAGYARELRELQTKENRRLARVREELLKSAQTKINDLSRTTGLSEADKALFNKIYGEAYETVLQGREAGKLAAQDVEAKLFGQGYIAGKSLWSGLNKWMAAKGSALVSLGINNETTDWLRGRQTVADENRTIDKDLSGQNLLDPTTYTTRLGTQFGMQAPSLALTVLTRSPMLGGTAGMMDEATSAMGDVYDRARQEGFDHVEAAQKARQLFVEYSALLPLHVGESMFMIKGLKGARAFGVSTLGQVPLEIAQEEPQSYFEQAKSKYGKGVGQFVREDALDVALETSIMALGQSAALSSAGQMMSSLATSSKGTEDQFYGDIVGKYGENAAYAVAEQQYLNGVLDEKGLIAANENIAKVASLSGQLQELGLDPNKRQAYVGLQGEIKHLQRQIETLTNIGTMDPSLLKVLQAQIQDREKQGKALMDGSMGVVVVTMPTGRTFAYTPQQAEKLLQEQSLVDGMANGDIKVTYNGETEGVQAKIEKAIASVTPKESVLQPAVILPGDNKPSETRIVAPKKEEKPTTTVIKPSQNKPAPVTTIAPKQVKAEPKGDTRPSVILPSANKAPSVTTVSPQSPAPAPPIEGEREVERGEMQVLRKPYSEKKYNWRTQQDEENVVTVYHGTGEDFKGYSKGKSSGTTRYGRGISFTDGKGIAMRYSVERQGLEDAPENDSKAIVKEAQLLIEKPFDEREGVDTSTREAQKLIALLNERYGLDPQLAENILKGNTKDSPFVGISKAIFDPKADEKTFMFHGDTEKTRRLLEEAGYDSIIGTYEDANEYFVFDQKDILDPEATQSSDVSPQSTSPTPMVNGAAERGEMQEEVTVDESDLYKRKKAVETNGEKYDLAQLMHSEENVFIIEQDGAEIGRATLSRDGDYLENIRINPEHRRKGLAMKLYDFIEESTGKKLQPSPIKQSTEAKKLWEKRNLQEKVSRKANAPQLAGLLSNALNTTLKEYKDKAAELKGLEDKFFAEKGITAEEYEALPDNEKAVVKEEAQQWLKNQGDVSPQSPSPTPLERVSEGERGETGPVNIQDIGEGFEIHRGVMNGKGKGATQGFYSYDKEGALGYANGEESGVTTAVIKPGAKVLRLVDGTTDNYDTNDTDLQAFVKIIGKKAYEGTYSPDDPTDITEVLWGNEETVAKLRKKGIDVVVGNSMDGVAVFVVNPEAISEKGSAVSPSKKEEFREAILTALESANGSEFSEVISDIALQDSDRKTAVKNIRKGKSTVATKKVEEAIEKMWADGYVYLNRGRGDHAESFQMPIAEFLDRLTQNDEAFQDLSQQAQNLQASLDALGEDLFTDAEEIITEVNNESPQSNELKTPSTPSQDTGTPPAPATGSNEATGTPGGPAPTPQSKSGKYEAKARKLADKVKAQGLPSWLRGIDDPNVKKMGLSNEDLLSLFETLVVSAGKAMDTGVALKDAVQAAADEFMDTLRAEYRKVGGKLKESAEAAIREGFVRDATEALKEKQPFQNNEKSILNRIYASENISAGHKERFAQEELKYTTASQDEARALAVEIINEFGVDASVQMAEAGRFNGDVNSLIFAEAIDRTFLEEQSATTPEEKRSAAERWADYSIRYDNIARDKGRFISAIFDFYKKSPLGIILKERKVRSQAFSEWYKSRAKGYDEVFEAIKDEPAFQQYVKEKVDTGLKQERAASRMKRRKKIEDIFESAKMKGGQMSATLVPPPIWNAAVEVMKQAALKGESVVAIIEQGIDHIKKHHTGTWDEGAFKEEWGEKLKAMDSGVASPLDKLKQRLRKQISDLQEQIDQGERVRKEKGTIGLDEEARALLAERDHLRSVLDQIDPPQKAPLTEAQRIQRAKKALEKSIQDYDRRIREKDTSKRESKTPDTEELRTLRARRDALKKQYDEMKAGLPPTDEEVAKKQAAVLDRFRKRMKGLSDSEKEEVIRRSFKKLVENGALSHADFKAIIADVLGLGEMTTEEVAQVQGFVQDMNAVQAAVERLQKERTPEAMQAFKAAVKKSEGSATRLAGMLYTKPKIGARIRAIIQLNTLGVVSLIKNVSYNIFYQLPVRFPQALFSTTLDYTVYGASLLANRVAGTRVIRPDHNVMLGQLGYWTKLKEGGVRSIQQVFTGLTSQDYFQKEVYNSQIKPFQSIRELWAWGKGEKHLSVAEWIDRFIQAFPLSGMSAEIIARGLNIGDKGFRFAAEGAEAEVIARTEFGLKGRDADIFRELPYEEALRIYRAKGLSVEAASQKAEAVRDRIVKAGESAVFQQDNMVADFFNAAKKKLQDNKDATVVQKGMGSAVRLVGVLNAPYLKTPLNLAWEVFNLINPEVALLQSMIYAGAAVQSGNHAFAIESKKWMAKAAVGMGWWAAAGTLAAAGLITGDDEEDKPRDYKGKDTYAKSNTINLSATMRFLSGGTEKWQDGDALLDLTWLGPIGTIMNIQANRHENTTKEDLAKHGYQEELLSRVHQGALNALNNSIFDGSIAGLNALQKGGGYTSSYFMNLLNVGANVVQPATLAQLQRAYIPYQHTRKADTFLDEVHHNFSSRNALYRLAAGYPPHAVTIWGDKQMKHDGSVGGVALTMLGVSLFNKDAFAEPIFQDFKRTGDNAFFPPDVSNEITVGKKKVELTAAQHTKLREEVGKARRGIVAPYVNDQATLSLPKGDDYNEVPYSKLPDDIKKRLLEKVYDAGYKLGRARFLQAHPELLPPGARLFEEEDE